MRTETNGNIKVTIFDEVVYDREKNVVVVERLTSTPTWVDVEIYDYNTNTNTIRYYFDQTDKITIELSDIIRCSSRGEINIYAETLEDFSFEYTTKHGVIPIGTIEPPHLIWKKLASQKLELIHSIPTDLINAVVLDALILGVWTEVIPESSSYNDSFDVPTYATMLRYKVPPYGFPLDHVDYSYVLIKEQVCGVRYVLLKWLSSYGNYKQQLFEVEERKTESTERQEKATMTNNYSVLKNRVDSLTVIMRDISAHDIEYYSDLVTSNEVFILSERDTTGEVYLTEQVDVQTKKITIPNGVTQKYDFKIDINHRHYDLF
jgi:hypothetical protein